MVKKDSSLFKICFGRNRLPREKAVGLLSLQVIDGILPCRFQADEPYGAD